jgi:hypothetical protein
MEISRILANILVSVISGSIIGIGLVVAYLTNARTKEKALHGSSKQKVIAYILRIGAVLGAYVIILISARTMNVFTKKTVFDAVFFIASLVGILLLARAKFITNKNIKSAIR